MRTRVGIVLLVALPLALDINAAGAGELDNAMKIEVAKLSRRLPLRNGDWVTTKIEYSTASRTLTSHINDISADVEEISVPRYKTLARGKLTKLVCSHHRIRDMKASRLAFAYRISDKSGKLIAWMRIRAVSC